MPSQLAQAAIDAVLLESKRRCALCFHDSEDTDPKQGNVIQVHLDDAKPPELVYLCLKHIEAFENLASFSDAAKQAPILARERLYDALLNRGKLARDWEAECDQAKTHADYIAQACETAASPFSEAFRDLYLDHTQRFCEQPPPATEGQLRKRLIQQIGLNQLGAAIALAANFAHLHPERAKAIYREVRNFCVGRALPTNVDSYVETSQLIARLSERVQTAPAAAK